MSGLAAFFASVGLHALVLGGIVAGMIVQPPETSGAGAWAGRTFEISSLSEVLPGGPAASGAAEATESSVAEGTRSKDDVGSEVAPPEAKPGAGDTDGSEEAGRAEPTQFARGAHAADAKPRGPTSVSQQHKPGSSSESPGAVAATTSSASGTASSEGVGASTSGGVYGAEGAAARRGNLPDAFTRALPAAARAQTAWRSLPLGPAGRAVVVVTLDDEGRVDEVTPLGAVPAHFEHLLRTARLLLQAGRFAPAPEAAAGEYRLGLRATLDQVEASVNENALPEQVRHLASRYPTRKEPGEATLIYNSGRRVRFEVFLDPARISE